VVIFIPGVYSGPINYIFDTYFKPQFEYLDRLGIPYCLSKGNSEHLISYNAEQLKQQIDLYSNNLTIVTHSKGGVDFLELINLYPEVKKKINKVIIMQAPFYGSPVADLLTSNFFGKLFVRFSLLILRGHKNCIHEIRSDVRADYMNKLDLKEVFSNLNITLICAYKSPESNKRFDSCLFPFRNWMFKNGILSDGLVPKESSVIEGLDTIVFSNLDHASAVVVRTPLKVDTKSFNDKIFSHLHKASQANEDS